MVDAFLKRYASRTRGVVIARGGHPLPNTASFGSGAEALKLADENRARGETLIVLLSGGASAMLAAPAEGVTLADKITATEQLLRSGRPIAEINAARKRLSAIKGGKLGARAGRSITFAISDVHGPIEDDPAVIGSGPTVPDRPATLPGARFVLVGSRRDAMAGARGAAERLGYAVDVIGPPIVGEAREAARTLADGLRARAHEASGRLCVIASGETTVTLPEASGHGGRNQEFALAIAMELGAALRYQFASVGTDGIDGPTDAAGAIVDETTVGRAREKGLDAAAALQAHDTYPLFAALGDLIVTGPTGTNVGDLALFLRPTAAGAVGT